MPAPSGGSLRFFAGGEGRSSSLSLADAEGELLALVAFSFFHAIPFAFMAFCFARLAFTFASLACWEYVSKEASPRCRIYAPAFLRVLRGHHVSLSPSPVPH